jgi:uncharacterized membrane protein YfcA
MAYKGRNDIRFSSMNILVPGIILGTILGGYSLTIVPAEQLGIFFGLLLLGMVVISVFRRKISHKKTNMASLGKRLVLWALP